MEGIFFVSWGKLLLQSQGYLMTFSTFLVVVVGLVLKGGQPGLFYLLLQFFFVSKNDTMAAVFLEIIFFSVVK
jgi:hypothetical protein